MANTKGSTALESVNTVIEVMSPALHDGRRGVPCIFTIGGKRFASNTPADPADAQEINNVLSALGGRR